MSDIYSAYLWIAIIVFPQYQLIVFPPISKAFDQLMAVALLFPYACT